MIEESSPEITRLIFSATKGRPFVFVVMPFGSKSLLFNEMVSIVDQTARLSCIRADDIPGAGLDLLEKVHAAIRRSELVIGEVSEINANVFYEVGYAAGIQKPILLVANRASNIPTDLRGRELILYSEDRGGMDAFRRDLAIHIKERVGTQLTLLNDMLVAERPRPAYILANPGHAGSASRITGHSRERRTFGDNLGIVRLLAAFGMIFGDMRDVELISAQYWAPDLEFRDLNLYLIGSKKTNPISGHMMDTMQEGSTVRWRFGPALGSTEILDYPNSLFRKVRETEYELHVRKGKWGEDEVYLEDHGIIIRGPHPAYPHRLVTIMAGAHSLGTAGASFAATHVPLIRDIMNFGIDISNREKSFWALVHATASEKNGLLDLDTVSILAAQSWMRPWKSERPAWPAVSMATNS